MDSLKNLEGALNMVYVAWMMLFTCSAFVHMMDATGWLCNKVASRSLQIGMSNGETAMAALGTRLMAVENTDSVAALTVQDFQLLHTACSIMLMYVTSHSDYPGVALTPEQAAAASEKVSGKRCIAGVGDGAIVEKLRISRLAAWNAVVQNPFTVWCVGHIMDLGAGAAIEALQGTGLAVDRRKLAAELGKDPASCEPVPLPNLSQKIFRSLGNVKAGALQAMKLLTVVCGSTVDSFKVCTGQTASAALHACHVCVAALERVCS